jgi:hypothetical protein
LLDPKTWLLVITAFTITLVNGALSGFGSILIRSFGFSAFHSVLLSGSAGAVVVVSLLTFGYVTPVYFCLSLNISS